MNELVDLRCLQHRVVHIVRLAKLSVFYGAFHTVYLIGYYVVAANYFSGFI